MPLLMTPGVWIECPQRLQRLRWGVGGGQLQNMPLLMTPGVWIECPQRLQRLRWGVGGGQLQRVPLVISPRVLTWCPQRLHRFAMKQASHRFIPKSTYRGTAVSTR
jgi:hypothetical protein